MAVRIRPQYVAGGVSGHSKPGSVQQKFPTSRVSHQPRVWYTTGSPAYLCLRASAWCAVPGVYLPLPTPSLSHTAPGNLLPRFDVVGGPNWRQVAVCWASNL